uniref:Uncharacterized protein LOC100180427 n=1 Tax=Phallusia mammillata TaxID=59560 RepID=A0A6F9DHR7_9ASCI|nr:uncharacterized protein LOC100180427 [Phallusia mammillata]
MSSKGVLLRRPRPPKPSNRSLLPPIASNCSSRLHASPELQMIPSSQLQDGMQSPVPTMQSDFLPVAKSNHQPKYQAKQMITYPMNSDDFIDPVPIKKNLIVPYKPRGPDPFPVREPKRPSEVLREYILPDDSLYYQEPDFRLDDFLQHNHQAIAPRPMIRKAILSKANYVKLTKLLQVSKAKDSDGPVSVSKVDLAEQSEIEPKQKRVPRRQVLLEMKKVIQERLEELGLTSPSRLGTSDQLEDVLDEIHEMGDSEGIGVKSQMCIFTKATEKIFQGAKRSGSPFEDEPSDSIITPAELAILNCLMEGGFVLSLKAHFISSLPDLHPLAHSLVYLNLSFNEFSDFPQEILFCRDLHVLKLRDNPLRDIPADISRLHRLRTLILSFCCLSALPISLFSLKSLEFLDLSYNKLTFLPNEIQKLENLRFLNVEGNELPGLPCGLLRLNLFRMRFRNNFMSPLFWRENSKNDPQRLSDLCCLSLQRNYIQDVPENYGQFPEKVIVTLQNFTYCDCCGQEMYGPGLRIIRPCSEIWGIKRMPFIFQACSPLCYSQFIQSTGPKISELIYGTSSNTETDRAQTPASI